ncbi:MAG TPA: hypothetical protein VHA52_02070, partial [Candidatus Babeliaceae bacterium]|nr:hypothetical protein [Candidatus Babeliaceae bacterium]
MESTATGLVGQPTSREQTMRSLIAEREHTGVPVKEFCAGRQLSESCYYYWRKKFSKKEGQPTASGTFMMLNLHDV